MLAWLRSQGHEPEPAGRDALSLTWMHLHEEFGTDHGEGMTYLRSIRFQRDRVGVVRFDIEQDVPPWR